MPSPTRNQIYLLIFCFALLLSISGFVLEVGFGAKPCQMCWWQRYAHYAIGAFALLGWVSCPVRKLWSFGLIALSALGGLAVAVWQVLAQHDILSPPGGCGGESDFQFAQGADLLASLNAPVASSCSDMGFTILGVSLATWNIPAMVFVLALCLWGVRTLGTCSRKAC